MCLLFSIVTLRSTDATYPNFRGFMIEGRMMADDSPTGSFVSGTNSQPVCTSDVSYITNC